MPAMKGPVVQPIMQPETLPVLLSMMLLGMLLGMLLDAARQHIVQTEATRNYRCGNSQRPCANQYGLRRILPRDGHEQRTHQHKAQQ